MEATDYTLIAVLIVIAGFLWSLHRDMRGRN